MWSPVFRPWSTIRRPLIQVSQKALHGLLPNFTKVTSPPNLQEILFLFEIFYYSNFTPFFRFRSNEIQKPAKKNRNLILVR